MPGGCLCKSSMKKNAHDPKPMDSLDLGIGAYKIIQADEKQSFDRTPIDTGIFARSQEGRIGNKFKGIKTMGTGAYGTVLAIEMRNPSSLGSGSALTSAGGSAGDLAGGGDREIYACKCLSKGSLDRNELEQLQQEIMLLKKCDHPNIIKFYGYYEDHKQVFLVQELCEGGELFDYITSPKFYENANKYSREKNAAIMIKQLLSGIAYLHQMGIVHRDMKPENVLLKNKNDINNLKIIDFGLSTKWNSSSTMIEQVGTPYYIAPEVLEKNYGPRCDVWSLGVILYILICGQAPFWGPDDRTILRKVRERKFTMQGNIWKAASPEVKDLITRMLIYPPQNRISAKEALQHPWFKLALSGEDYSSPGGILSKFKLSIGNSTGPNATGHNASGHNASGPTPFDGLTDQVVNNLRKLHGFNRLQHAIRLCIGYHANKDADIKTLTDTFKSMDTDGNGILDKEEFIKAYMAYKSQGAKKMVDCSETGAAVSAMSSNTGQAAPATASTAGASAMTMTGVAKATDNASAEGLELISDVLEQEAEDMFTRMDLNQDGYIGISEWLAVTLDDTYVANRARLSSAFSVFDIDGNGEIDIQEFIDILQPSKKSQPELKNYVEKFDLDHNGKLSFEEFCKVIENTPQDVIKKTETKE